MANYPIKNIVVGSDTYNVDTNFALVQLSYNLTTSDNLSGKTFAEILSEYNGTWAIASITDAKGSHNPSTEMLSTLGRSLNYNVDWTITYAGGGSASGHWGTGCKPVLINDVVIPLTGTLGNQLTISGFVYLYVDTSTNTVTQRGVFKGAGGGGSMNYDIIASEFGDDIPSHPQIYSQYDIVINNGSYYRSLKNNNEDTLDVPTSWAPTNGQSSSYVGNGNFCVVNDEYYINLSGGSQSWDPSHWADMGFVKADYKGNWSAGTTGYLVGDYCIYNDNLYRCITANAGTTWNAAQWTLTQVMNEIGNLGIANLDGVNITNPTAGDTLVYDGTNWINTAGSSGSNAIILDLNTNDNLNQIEQQPPSGNINLVTPITLSDLETAIANGIPCYITTKANHAIRDTLTKYNTFNYEFNYMGWANGSPRSLSVVLNVSGGTASSVHISTI